MWLGGRGMARPGMERCGELWLGCHVLARRSWRGVERKGVVRYGGAVTVGLVWKGVVRWRLAVEAVEAWCGREWLGKSRPGGVRRSIPRLG